MRMPSRRSSRRSSFAPGAGQLHADRPTAKASSVVTFTVSPTPFSGETAFRSELFTTDPERPLGQPPERPRLQRRPHSTPAHDRGTGERLPRAVLAARHPVPKEEMLAVAP